MKPVTAIALSGGVDSMMAAHRLLQDGHDVIGIHFLTGYEVEKAAPCGNGIPPEGGETLAARIAGLAGRLGIPLKILDLKVAFETSVVAYFAAAYEKGLTPNPCMVCNPVIKFGALLDYARMQGAERLATGHYARLRRDSRGRFHLLRGIDRSKDQSYFLAFLRQEQLGRALFPVGEFTKADVRKMAAANRLQPVTTGESQDICFIRGLTYGEFLTRRREFAPEPGPIADVRGNLVGRHRGLHLFTVGQRRGINCPASEPYYVIRIDREKNRLIVGFKSDQGVMQCRVTDINWILESPAAACRLNTRLRYRHRAVPAIVDPVDERTALVRFDRPEAAVTPGQGAVFYEGEEVLGGGWIGSDE